MEVTLEDWMHLVDFVIFFIKETTVFDFLFAVLHTNIKSINVALGSKEHILEQKSECQFYLGVSCESNVVCRAAWAP